MKGFNTRSRIIVVALLPLVAVGSAQSFASAPQASVKAGLLSAPAKSVPQAAEQPGKTPISMIPAAERTPEQWMEYLGIRLVETRDSSGPAVLKPKPGDLYFITNESTTWGATNQRNNVVFIDAKTKKPIAQTNLPDEYSVNFGSHGVAASSDGKWLYLPAQGAKNYLLVIDGQTLKLHKVYQSLGRPHHINNFTGPDGRELIMVVDFGWSYSGSGIWVLDPEKDNIVVGGMSRQDFSGHPYVAGRDINGQYMYVTVPAPTAALREKMEGYLAKINLKTWKVEQAIPMLDPIWPEVSVDGKTAWVTLGGPSKVAKVDLEKGVVIDEFATGPGPWGARLSFDEGKLYIADKGETFGYGQQGRTMTIMDTENNIATKVIPIGLTTDHIILSPDGKEVWATSNADHLIVVVDTETEEPITTIKMPNDGDTHGSTFIQYKDDGKGGVVGEVVSSFTGLRGSALAKQKEALQGPKPKTVSITPFNKFFSTPGSFNPPALVGQPGELLRLSFANNAGTSGGIVSAESPALGITKLELKPGMRKLVELKLPAKEGDYQVVNPADPKGKPLIITVKKVTAPAEAAPEAAGIREIKLTTHHMMIENPEDVKVKVGETVRFVLVNGDDEKHNLVGIGEGLNLLSPDVGSGQTGKYEWTAPDKPGTYKIVCAYHPSMLLNLVIEK